MHYVAPVIGADGKPVLGSDGQPKYDPTPEFDAMRRVLEHVDVVMGEELAVKVGPALFEKLQNHMIGLGYCRKNINRLISRAKRLFKWACVKEYCPSEIYARLACVETLRKGRSTAKERGDVTPVPLEVVEATLPWLSPVVADMVRVQLICGMRPSEVCNMRPADIDRTGDIWLYQPEHHKNEWRDQLRIIAVPKAAQEVIAKYLDRPQKKYLFSPRESEKKRNDAKTGTGIAFHGSM